MRLSELLPIAAAADSVISGLALDSRQIQPGYVFLALQGHKTHGEHYIQTALERGAQAILKEATVAELTWLNQHIPCISVPQLSQKVGHLAAQFYGYPTKQLRVIGVTGTNGKTSTTHFIAQLLPQCALIGTLGYGVYGQLTPGRHTTPDALQLQALLAQFRTQNLAHVVMEVSSHALVQGRVNAIDFEVAIFTNLTRDHLDYHGSMSAYGQAKQKLFTTPGLKTAIINQDDAFGRQLCTQLPSSVLPLTYGMQTTADVYAHIYSCDAQGYRVHIHTPWGSTPIQIPLIGHFNLSNVLAALTVLLQWGLPLAELETQVSQLKSVPGRMQCLGQQPRVIIDYAHTPDALTQVLLALRNHCPGQLWCIFGCGGDRDVGKRSLMGACAQNHADKVILTNDNPRYEASQAIIDAILQGCPQPTAVIADRRQAIVYALHHAAAEDIVLIAGKGHEAYQHIGDQRLPFSDSEVVQELMLRL